MLHLLPCLTTFNIVGYKTERELNIWCGVLLICNSLHVELHLTCSIVCCTLPCLFQPVMHHTCLCIMPWLCLCVYHVVCFFPGCLRFRFGVVRIRSTTSACLLHGLVLLPCGISGKMTATLDVTTIIAMLVASFCRFAALPILLLFKPPKLPWTSNLCHPS